MTFLTFIVLKILDPPFGRFVAKFTESLFDCTDTGYDNPMRSSSKTATDAGAIDYTHHQTLMNHVHDAGARFRRMLAAMASDSESRTRGGDIVDHRRGVDQPVPPLAALFDGTFLGDQPLVQIVTTGHAGGAGVLAT